MILTYFEIQEDGQAGKRIKEGFEKKCRNITIEDVEFALFNNKGIFEFVGTKEQQINTAKVGIALVNNNTEVAEYLSGEAEAEVEGAYSGTPAKPAIYSKYGPVMIIYVENFLGTKTTEFIELRKEEKSYYVYP